MAQDIGLLLRGLGAAFSNTVPQFRQEMAQEQEAQYLQQQREQENQYLQQQRASQAQMQVFERQQMINTAFAQDIMQGQQLLKSGDFQSLFNLSLDTAKNAEMLGVPTRPAAEIAMLSSRAMAGDAAAIGELDQKLNAYAQQYQRFMPEAEITTVKPGETVLRGGEPVFTAPMEAKAPIPRTDEARLKADFDAGLITQAQYDAGIARLAQGTPQNVWQESGDLRKEFSGIPAVRQFAEQAGAFGRIEASASNPSAAGDLALIFNYMKVLDPGSTVREGEFANAQNAAGIPERIRALYNNAMQGTRLTETQRSDFLSRARNLYENAERSYMRTYNQYKDIAERRNLPLADALIDYRYQSSMQFPQFFNSQAEADAANLPSGSVFEIPNPEDPDEILQLRVR
jgi:Sec-independent protein translocase protein TatA